MRMAFEVARCAVVLGLGLTSFCCSQAQLPAYATGFDQNNVVREIDDPHTGDHWLLMRNDSDQGGPGRLVLAQGRSRSEKVHARTVARQMAPGVESVIHAGERLTVEEHTAVADSVLEARALGPAAVGSVFEVRLTIGGKVVRVVALGSGHAVLQTESGARP